MNYEFLVFDLIITAFSYFIAPFIKFIILKKAGTKEQIKTFILKNSVIVALIFVIIRAVVLQDETPIQTFAPAVLYYYFNYLIYIVWLKLDKIEYSGTNKDSTNKIRNVPNKKKAIILGIIGIIFFAGLSVYQALDKDNIKKELESEILDLKREIRILKSSNEYYGNRINNIIGEHTYEYVINKLIFFDDNIVFVIDGYGNYYSDYDCMLQRVGNNRYSYWAFNKEAAINHGYQEFKCN